MAIRRHLIRSAYFLFALTAPRLAARIAAKRFVTPRKLPRRPWELERLATSRRQRFQSGLMGAVWGSGPAVLLLHGWEHRGVWLSDFVGPLVEAGFRAVALDWPAHGDSHGDFTTPPESVEKLIATAAEIGNVHGIVGHSYGGAVGALAMARGLPASRFVLIAGPCSFGDVLERHAMAIGFPARAKHHLRAAMAQLSRASKDELDLTVQTVRVPALIVHDRHDPVLPLIHAERVRDAWPAAELVVTEGLGHSRLLRDAAVIARVTAFMQAPVASLTASNSASGA